MAAWNGLPARLFNLLEALNIDSVHGRSGDLLSSVSLTPNSLRPFSTFATRRGSLSLSLPAFLFICEHRRLISVRVESSVPGTEVDGAKYAKRISEAAHDWKSIFGVARSRVIRKNVSVSMIDEWPAICLDYPTATRTVVA